MFTYSTVLSRCWNYSSFLIIKCKINKILNLFYSFKSCFSECFFITFSSNKLWNKGNFISKLTNSSCIFWNYCINFSPFSSFIVVIYSDSFYFYISCLFIRFRYITIYTNCALISNYSSISDSCSAYFFNFTSCKSCSTIVFISFSNSSLSINISSCNVCICIQC